MWYLVEENIFPISTLSCKIFQISILAYSMLLTQLLPKLAPNYKNIRLERSDLSRQQGSKRDWRCVLLFPHWPACMVIISLEDGQLGSHSHSDV